MRDERLSRVLRATGRRALLATGLAALTALTPSPALAGVFAVFEPEDFVKDGGAPTIYTRTFSVLDPGAPYTVRIDNGGVDGRYPRVSSGLVFINGVKVVGTDLFNQQVAVIEVPVTLAAENQMTVEVRSLPNSGFRLVIYGRDDVPPTIAATVSPPANAAGWHNSAVTVSFACADATSGVPACPDDVVVDQEAEGLVVSRTATDNAGNQATASVTLNIDLTPPALAIEAPADGGATNLPTAEVRGTASDRHGIAALTVNGQPAPVAAGRFSAQVDLVDGGNTISVVARDIADNQTTKSVTTHLFSIPGVVIDSPLDGTLTAAPSVEVRGSVDDPDATVEVAGLPAAVSGGAFVVPSVPLREGGNLLTAVARKGSRVGTASIQVFRDSTPPTLHVTSPADGAVVSTPAVTVSGLVNDLVVGTVMAAQATVTVNGVTAQVANRNFLAPDVPLAPGPNTLTVIATDRAGNVASATLQVRFEDPAGKPRIAAVGGSNQVGVIGSELPLPLEVAVSDASGGPLAGRTVIFRVADSNGALRTAVDGPARSLALTTDAQGRAAARWILGSRAGAGRDRVTASAVGIGRVEFVAVALPAAPDKISLDAGNNQIGVVGRQLAMPLVAVVTDAGHNRLEGVPVTFQVLAGGGIVAGASEAIIASDSDGAVAAYLTLGPEPGFENNVVEVTFPGNPTAPVVFVASGKVAGDLADTRVSGVVVDNTDLPIAGVTVSLAGTGLATTTDARGQFTLAPAPVGLVHLVVDGATAQRPGVWPPLAYELVTVAGQDNTVGRPIPLLPLDLANGVFVDETRGGTIRPPRVPGFALEIAPGSATFPDGSRSGLVSVTLVHADKVPMTPNFGQQPRVVVTIQPVGVHFDPPAALTLPNVDGLAPGEVTEMYSFDHDLNRFVSIGTGTVSEDGTVVRSDPGVGVVEGGWHCGGNPATSGGAENAHVSIANSDPERVEIDETVTVNASGGPQPGTYDWTVDDSGVARLEGPTSGPNASSVTVRGQGPGTTKVQVTYTCESGASDTDDIEVEVPTKDVTVIAWVDPGPPQAVVNALESQISFLLDLDLNGPLRLITCPLLLLDWSAGFRVDLFSEVDVRYSNAYLLAHSPNAPPPASIDPDAEKADGDFRLFNRLQVVIDKDQSPPGVEFLHADAVVGKTPDPCGLLPPVGGQTHPENGAKGLTNSQSGVFQLAEGRLGTLGQAVDLTLNDCDSFLGQCLNHPAEIGKTTPWIWSVIRFDLDGNRGPIDHQIFPTYYVYEDGELVEQFPQSDAEVFIALDETSQRHVSEIP